MALTGSLRDMSLVNLISISCNERNQARLVVRANGGEAAVYFFDGQIVHASLGTQEGEEVIYEVLGWGEGEFELEQGVEAPKNTVTAGWSGMLLKGLSRIDETRAGWEIALDEEGQEEKKKKEDESKIMERMTKALKRIDGIQGVLICSQKGELLCQDTAVDPAQESTLIASVILHLDVLDDLLSSGRLKQIILTRKERRRMIVTYKQNYVMLSLALQTPVESMIPAIQLMLRRYS